MKYKATSNDKRKGRYMTIIHDRIETEFKRGSTSATLLGILSNMGVKKLSEWADFCESKKNTTHENY